jgi:hypothetical protein
MSRGDASEGDMANFLSSVPGDRPQQWNDHLEALLSGQRPPESADAELQGVGELLATLAAAPMDRVERRGQVSALNTFRETFADVQPSRQRRRRPAMLSTVLGAKLGAALAAGAVSFGAIGAAAYTGVLPSGLQNLAHTTVGAPAADQAEAADPVETPEKAEAPDRDQTADKDKSADKNKSADSATKTAVGPDATGPAAFGLCTAWTHVQANGQVAEKSVAFRNLATAATGVGKIAGYCANVPHPGATEAGKPATHPRGQSSSRPTGRPSTHPTGKPGSSAGTSQRS